MTASRRIGVLGGTFDPIHFGHLDAAEAARASLRLDEILFLPSNDPPHRSRGPIASVFHRFALIALGIQDREAFRVSDLELTRAGVSYTADTLRALHAEGWGRLELFFILGADAFAEISTWREYPQVLDSAHFVVVARPGLALDNVAARVPALRSRIHHASEDVAEDGHTRVFLVDAPTRDVSSTMVRERLARGLSIDALVPGIVAAHIAAHHLYGAVGTLHGTK